MNPHFRDILSALSAEEAEFLVVGAYALAAHGLPRATGDLDLWVNPTEANAARVWRALLRFGAPLSGYDVKDFQTLNTVFRMGLPPSQVDVITSITGVDFESAWTAREIAEVEGTRVPVISVANQIRNKRAAGRPKDMLDADWLERKNTKSS